MEKNRDFKETVFATAAGHFADYGFEGARMDRIAEAAGVNKARIYYNIGNKEALYAFVMNRMMEDSFGQFQELARSGLTPEQKLGIYVERFAHALATNPHIPKILMREQLTQGRHMSEQFVEKIVRVLDGLNAILEEGVEKGVFDPVDTITIHFMAMGSLTLHTTSAPIRRTKKGFSPQYRPDSGKLSQAVVDQVKQCILKAVKKGTGP